jgi:lipid-A-disaccharide synthase
MKRVFIIAGETSGDLHGASLMAAMRQRDPDIEFRGIGGTRMIAEGLNAFRRVRDMNFMGFAEVVRHLPFIRRTFRDAESILDDWSPDLAILIDYPGFNLRLAPKLKRREIPVMYYISPQLWAWHSSRVNIIRQNVDRMVVLFSFEQEFYHQHGIAADCVGHPLIDIVQPSLDRASFRERVGAEDGVPVVGLLPGSRQQEIDRILPAMTGAVGRIRESLGEVIPVLGCAPDLDAEVYEPYLRDMPGIVSLRGMTYDVMAHADALVVTSGTATVEAGILGTPMVIVYRTSPLTWHIGRWMVKVPHVGMINIVANGRIVPELLQGAVTPERIAGHIAEYLRDPTVHARVSNDLVKARAALGEPGAADRAAGIALEMLS